jgi:hypothetical protein
MRGSIRCLGPLLALGLLVAAPSAHGFTRLGPDLTNAPGAGFVAVGCQMAPQYQPCGYLTYSSSNPQVLAQAPANGVITSWRFRAGCCTDQTDRDHTLTLRTYRRGVQTAGGYPYAVAAGTGPSFVIPAGNQLPGDPPVTLPARLPIQAGEMVGIQADYPISFAVYNPTSAVLSTVLFNGYEYFGEQYGNPITETAIAINADVEADADADGYGDETQDCAPADAAFNVDCSSLPGGGPNPPSDPPPSTPPSNPPVFVPGGGCQSNCGGGAVFGGFTGGGFVPQPSGDGSKVYIPLSCPPGATQPCGGFLILNQASPKQGVVLYKELGRVEYVVAPGQTQKVKLNLSKAGRKLLKKKGKLKVQITIDPNEGDSTTIAKTLKLPH